MSSAITPVLLGACLGAVSSGQLRVAPGAGAAAPALAWIGPFPLATGLLALAVCAYLAAVYLTLETGGEVREDFRRRALGAWLVAGALSLAVLLLAFFEAPRLWQRLTGRPALPVVAAGVCLAPLSAWAMLRRRFGWARVLAAGQVVVLLTGWAIAQWPYILYPDVTLHDAAGAGGDAARRAHHPPLRAGDLAPLPLVPLRGLQGPQPRRAAGCPGAARSRRRNVTARRTRERPLRLERAVRHPGPGWPRLAHELAHASPLRRHGVVGGWSPQSGGGGAPGGNSNPRPTAPPAC